VGLCAGELESEFWLFVRAGPAGGVDFPIEKNCDLVFNRGAVGVFDGVRLGQVGQFEYTVLFLFYVAISMSP